MLHDQISTGLNEVDQNKTHLPWGGLQRQMFQTETVLRSNVHVQHDLCHDLTFDNKLTLGRRREVHFKPRWKQSPPQAQERRTGRETNRKPEGDRASV